MKYWLMKSEPDEFSIDDLARMGCNVWDGVRNYQARNFMRDMQKGDLIFFYHSSCKPAGIAGIMQLERCAYPDPSAINPQSPYYDTKSLQENRWSAVDVRFVKKFNRLISLETIKQMPELHDMLLISRSRLSVMPVSMQHWEVINALL